MIEIVSGILMLSGALAVFIGALGLVRLPRFFMRIHAAGVIDTLGAWLVLVGLMLLATSAVVVFKVLLLVALLYWLSPVVSHALARCALEDENRAVDSGGAERAERAKQ